LQNPIVLEKLTAGEAKTVGDAVKAVRRDDNQRERERLIENGVGSDIESGKVINGDLFGVIDEIDDMSVDLLFADPPYMILDDEWDVFGDLEQFKEFTKKWLDCVMPKCKQTGRVYISFSQRFQFELYNLLRDSVLRN